MGECPTGKLGKFLICPLVPLKQYVQEAEWSYRLLRLVNSAVNKPYQLEEKKQNNFVMISVEWRGGTLIDI